MLTFFIRRSLVSGILVELLPALPLVALAVLPTALALALVLGAGAGAMGMLPGLESRVSSSSPGGVGSGRPRPGLDNLLNLQINC